MSFFHHSAHLPSLVHRLEKDSREISLQSLLRPKLRVHVVSFLKPQSLSRRWKLVTVPAPAQRVGKSLLNPGTPVASSNSTFKTVVTTWGRIVYLGPELPLLLCLEHVWQLLVYLLVENKFLKNKHCFIQGFAI